MSTASKERGCVVGQEASWSLGLEGLPGHGWTDRYVQILQGPDTHLVGDERVCPVLLSKSVM